MQRIELCLPGILLVETDTTYLEVKEKGPIHFGPSELSPVFSKLQLVFQPIENLYEKVLHGKLVITKSSRCGN